MEIPTAVSKAIKGKKVKFLCKHLFDFDATPKQEDLIRRIMYTENLRLLVCAMTRWGKTICVAMGIALFLLIQYKPKKIAFVAPQKEQADLIRTYMSELILKCDLLLNLAELDVVGVERLKKEATKTRLTFKNGCEYRIFSAHGDANRLMGFGADVVIKDESCLISREANTKIMRMLGDNPDKAMLIELYNPWDRDNNTFDHTMNKEFHQIHISWQDALKEGRTTQRFIDEQRKEVTPLEFTVLYDSLFPEQSEDAIFSLGDIKKAKILNLGYYKEIKRLLEILKESHKHTESEVKEAKDGLKQFKLIISCDVADKGLDETVIFWGVKKGNKYVITGYYSEATSDNMQIAGRINKLIVDFIGRTISGKIHIDCIGVGAGVVSRVKEFIRLNNYKNVRVVACHFGEAAIKKERFLNKKAENYFRAKDLFIEGQLDILDITKLTTQLISMKWELTSAGKIKIIDPEKSPDYPDALIYFIWVDTTALAFAFG